jgi:hypothetical protein
MREVSGKWFDVNGDQDEIMRWRRDIMMLAADGRHECVLCQRPCDPYGSMVRIVVEVGPGDHACGCEECAAEYATPADAANMIGERLVDRRFGGDAVVRLEAGITLERRPMG